MCVLLITWLLRLVGRWARKPVNHTSWVALVTPTGRPKSVRNRCLIELFCGVVCVVTCPFDMSVGVGAFVIGLGQISSFLSWYSDFIPRYSSLYERSDIRSRQLVRALQLEVLFFRSLKYSVTFALTFWLKIVFGCCCRREYTASQILSLYIHLFVDFIYYLKGNSHNIKWYLKQSLIYIELTWNYLYYHCLT